MADDNDPWAAFRSGQSASADPDPWAAFRDKTPTAAPEGNRVVYPERGGVAPGPASSGDPTYDLFVSQEAQNDPRRFGQKAQDVSKYYGELGILSGDAATFGLGNRAMAYGRALADGYAGEGVNYGKRIDEQNAYLNKLRAADPDRAVVAELLGGYASGAGLGRAGLTLAKPTAGWINRAVRGGAEGAGYGAAQAVGQNYGDVWEKGAAAVPGGILGFGMGAGIPLAASAGTSIWNALGNRLSKLPVPLLRAVEADRAGVEGLSDMGPAAMLPDAGPSVRGLAQGASTTPGPGRTALHENLTAREQETIPRMTAERERILGPAPIPPFVESANKAARREMGPEWEKAFEGAKAVDTQKIANRIDELTVSKRGGAQAAMETIRPDLNIKGTDVLDPHPRTLHEVRMAIDDMLFDKKLPPDTRQTLAEVRDMIREELHSKVPGMANLDARYSEKASQLEAFQRGQEVFDTSREKAVHPKAWRQELEDMGKPKGRSTEPVQGETTGPVQLGPSAAPHYSRGGTSAEIDRLVGTGTDDLRVLERKFGPHNWATQKLAEQFGVKSADEFREMLTTNRTFRESYNKIVHGSKTAETLAAADEAGGVSIPSLSLRGIIDMASRGAESVRAGSNATQRNRIAEIMATQGADLGPLVQQLLSAGGEQAKRDITRTIVENALRRSLIGTVPEATR